MDGENAGKIGDFWRKLGKLGKSLSSQKSMVESHVHNSKSAEYEAKLSVCAATSMFERRENVDR